MSEIDLTQLKSVIQPFVPLGRLGLLPALHAVQKIHGWLPQEVAAEVAKSLRVPLADVHGVIEFYSLFTTNLLAGNLSAFAPTLPADSKVRMDYSNGFADITAWSRAGRPRPDSNHRAESMLGAL